MKIDDKHFTYSVEATSINKKSLFFLTLVLLNPDMSFSANSVDPDQLASEEANWSGSVLFVIKYVNLYKQPASSTLID